MTVNPIDDAVNHVIEPAKTRKMVTEVGALNLLIAGERMRIPLSLPSKRKAPASVDLPGIKNHSNSNFQMLRDVRYHQRSTIRDIPNDV